MPGGSISDLQMAEYNPQTITVLSNNPRTTSGASGAFESPPARNGKLAVLISITASSGTTPTLDVSLEWSHNGTTFYPSDPADAFTQMTGTAPKFKSFDIKANYFRVVYAIAGTTPSFSFGATATGR